MVVKVRDVKTLAFYVFTSKVTFNFNKQHDMITN